MHEELNGATENRNNGLYETAIIKNIAEGNSLKMVSVPAYVLNAFLEVWYSGTSHVLDSTAMIREMAQQGHFEAVNWLIENGASSEVNIYRYRELIHIADEMIHKLKE